MMRYSSSYDLHLVSTWLYMWKSCLNRRKHDVLECKCRKHRSQPYDSLVVISSTHCITAYIVCTLNATILYSKRWIQPMFKCLKLAFFLMQSQVSGHVNYTLIVILLIIDSFSIFSVNKSPLYMYEHAVKMVFAKILSSRLSN